MHRFKLLLLILSFAYPAALCADTAQPDAAQIKAGLQAIQQSLPALKENLDKVKSKGQDISYPMISYTVMENFTEYALEDMDKGEVIRASYQLSDMEWMKRKLENELSKALSGKLTFPKVPRWTGDTRPVIKGSSFIGPTTISGKTAREIRPIFFTGFGHFGQVQADIEKWPNYGTNIIQFEIGPWTVFPEEGKVVDPGPGLLKTLDRAQKAGVAVNLLLSTHYFPNWMLNKYPELRKKREYFFPMCLHAPETQDLIKKYVQIVVSPIKDHPALQSICISNEPRNVEEPCKYATEQFRAWLKERHGDIATLNDRWGTSYASYEEISVPNPFAKDAQEPICRWADFVRWNQEFVAEWHKMMADAVHAAAPNVPVHAKIQDFTLGNTPEMKCGNDAFLYSGFCDINGNDSPNYYDFGKDEFACSWLGNGIWYSLQRSIKNAPIQNSENHLIRDRDTNNVPPEHIRTALWQQAILGQSATTIWVWQRMYNTKDDLYGSIINRPGCARAVGITNCDLNRAAKEVTALQQAPAQVFILHSNSSLVFDKEECNWCMFRAYIALNFCGLKVGLITERQLEAGVVPEAALLCIPNAKHLSNAAFATLKKYKGRLVMLGEECLAFDEFNKPRQERLNGFTIPFKLKETYDKGIFAILKPKLAEWKIGPKIKITDDQGKPIWGIEYKEVSSSDGILINVCNYLKKPVNIKLAGKGLQAKDVLTQELFQNSMKLKPLEVRLLKIKS